MSVAYTHTHTHTHNQGEYLQGFHLLEIDMLQVCNQKKMIECLSPF